MLTVPLSQEIKEQMQPVEMEVGDVMLIHGAVDHMSYENTSGKSRRSFQIHLVEGKEGGAVWHEDNVCYFIYLIVVS